MPQPQQTKPPPPHTHNFFPFTEGLWALSYDSMLLSHISCLQYLISARIFLHLLHSDKLQSMNHGQLMGYNCLRLLFGISFKVLNWLSSLFRIQPGDWQCSSIAFLKS